MCDWLCVLVYVCAVNKSSFVVLHLYLDFSTFWKVVSDWHFPSVVLGFDYFFFLKSHSNGLLILQRHTSEMKLNNSVFIIDNFFKRQIAKEWKFSIIFQRLFFLGCKTIGKWISKCEFNGNYCKLENMSTLLKSKSSLNRGSDWVSHSWKVQYISEVVELVKVLRAEYETLYRKWMLIRKVWSKLSKLCMHPQDYLNVLVERFSVTVVFPLNLRQSMFDYLSWVESWIVLKRSNGSGVDINMIKWSVPMNGATFYGECFQIL